MTISKSYTLPFSVERVYEAWVSSKTVIPPATRMDINPVVGGHYRLFIESPEFVAQCEGEFLAVEPGKHVRYSWEWNKDGEVTEIDVTFTQDGEATVMTLLHSGFRNPDSQTAHDQGWDSYIEGLKSFLSQPTP